MAPHIDIKKQREVGRQVTIYIQPYFLFVVFPVFLKEDRLLFESRFISTVSLCESCQPSSTWLGLYSLKERIRESGLWLVNRLNGQLLTQSEFEKLM